MIIVNLFIVKLRSSFEREVGGRAPHLKGIKINDCVSSSRSQKDTRTHSHSHSQTPLLEPSETATAGCGRGDPPESVHHTVCVCVRMIERGSVVAVT